MAVLLLITSVVFAVVALIAEYRALKKKKRLTITSFFLLVFVFTYGILPLLVVFLYLFEGFSISTSNYSFDYSEKGLFYTWIWQIFSIFSYVIVKKAAKHKETLKSATYGDAGLKIETTALEYTVIICLVAGIISLYLWSRAYGGIIELIKVGSAVRSRLSRVVNDLAFFKHIAKSVLTISYASLILVKQGKHKLFNAVIFLISFSFSILYLLANDGRMSIAFYFLVIGLIMMRIFEIRAISRKKKIGITLLLVTAVVFILNLDSITYYIKFGVWGSEQQGTLLHSLLNELAFIMISGQKALQHAASFKMLIIDDILCGLFAWFPTSIKPVETINIWNYNTELATIGFWGQFPCDFLSTSLYDLSFLGPFLFPLFWGKILSKIEKMPKNGSIVKIICYYALFTPLIRTVDYCLLYDFVLGMFPLALFLIVYAVLRRILIGRGGHLSTIGSN